MRNLFPFYYHLTEEEKKALFMSKDCYFAFDTNALLDIYRLGKDTAEKVLQLLDKYKGRIIIPKQVAWEYHKNMLDIITEICSKYDNFLRQNDTDQLLRILSSSLNVENFPSLKRKVFKYLKPAIDEMFIDLKTECDYIKKQFHTWELQNKLSDALGSLVLSGFSEDEINKIEKEGEVRYAKEIPPGYKDLKNKDTNVYGDLIIWKEILEFAKSKGCSVVFIGRDMKEDWLQEIHGMTCGPRQELLDEFYRYSPKGKFHIYTLDQFLKFVNEIDKVLNDSELSEVKELTGIPIKMKSDETKNKSSVPVKMSTPDADKSDSKQIEDKSTNEVGKTKAV